MKKYIFTESQVKNIIKTQINEQTEEMNLNKAVQCFLNKLYKTNLVVDGDHGPKTENLIKKLQTSRGVWPVDGVWGSNTYDKLKPNEIAIYRDCRSEYGDIVDKAAHGLRKIGNKISSML
jgi:hypothetical protein